MKFLVIVCGLGAAMAMAAVGACGPKQQYCPELGGPCFDNDGGPMHTDNSDAGGGGDSVVVTGGP